MYLQSLGFNLNFHQAFSNFQQKTNEIKMSLHHSRDYSLILIRLKSFIKGSAIKTNKILMISISYSSTLEFLIENFLLFMAKNSDSVFTIKIYLISASQDLLKVITYKNVLNLSTF
jgi:hypothetical protein